MTRPAASVPAPSRLIAAVALAGLASLTAITLVSPGATRMLAWPWTLLHAIALVAPGLVLIARSLDHARPLVLPARPWVMLGAASVAVVLAATLFSPHQGPSLLASAPLLAGIAVFFAAFDWIQGGDERATQLAGGLGIFFAAIALVSLALWAGDLRGLGAGEVLNVRNGYPLGHSNYTAGLALLALPWFARLGLRHERPASYAWAAALAFALVMLFTSGSRGGVLGLAALLAGAVVAAPLDRGRKIHLGIGLLLIGLAVGLAHPRTRTMFQPSSPDAALNVSNVQRSAMLTAGMRMGADRPVLGWGPGATPLVYPRYRAGLEGGAENVLQLHSGPVQLWAELGTLGLACAMVFGGLVVRNARRDPTAALALVGYGVLALTDWQLDVPVFAFAIAACAALLAAPEPTPASNRTRLIVSLTALPTLALIALLGRREPMPEMNVRALTLARDPAQTDRAIALLNDSLALDPDQEIAHFNLGWLLVVRDPATAEKHFRAAAHLVPDKGGVYFGLGLARLNQGQPAAAARAFALECLSDPAFLGSPWWNESAIAAQRDATAAAFTELVAVARSRVAQDKWLTNRLAELAARASTLGRVGQGPVGVLHRERLGYPVLMRNLDLEPPRDVYEVREFTAPPVAGNPPKGWLPSPLLIELLDAPGVVAPK